MSNFLPDKEPISRSVEDYLNLVDYSIPADYVPSDFALEFVTFVKLVNGEEGEENKTPLLHYYMLDQLCEEEDLANMVHRGAAKALTLDTQLLTPKGNVSMGDIQVGDEVFTRNGTPTKVTHKSEIFHKPIYQITLVDGRKLKVSEDHLNIVQRRKTGKGVPAGSFTEEVLSTTELLGKGVHYQRRPSYWNPTGQETKWYVPTAAPVQLPTADSPLDAYTVGVILGDGSIGETGFVRVHTHTDDLEHFRAEIPYETGAVRADKRRPDTLRFSVRGISKPVKAFIGTENVYGKRVPQQLMWGSVTQRQAVVQGLMDTDGTPGKQPSSPATFTTVSEGLANDMLWLVRSLGGEAKLKENHWEGRQSFRVHLRTDFCPFRLQRKAIQWQPNVVGRTGIASVEQIEQEPSQCIAVADETHAYLAEQHFVTHNTTLFGEYLFLYTAVYTELPRLGKVNLALYVSDSIENGVKNMRKNLEFRWENSEFLQKYIPHTRFTDVRYEFVNIDGHRLVVKGYGAKTGVRGAKEMGQRPTLAVLDDLVSDEDARSKTVIAAIEDTIYKAVNYALHPSRRKIIWSGTPFNASDPLYKAVESGAWKVNVYPVCERFPCAPEDFRGSWPDRFTYEYVKKEYDKALKSGKIDTFNQELMLRIMSDEDRLITAQDIRWYRREALLANRPLFNFYITTDFATSEHQKADFSVISVWAYNNRGQWFWVDGVCRQQGMRENLDDLFRLAQMYKPMDVGVEVNGQQGGFIPWIQDKMMSRNIWFSLASEGNSNKPGIRRRTDKLSYFQTIVPEFKLGNMHFPEELRNDPRMIECMEELLLASKSGLKAKRDDFIDTISMLTAIRAWKPSEAALMEQDGDMWTIREEEEDNPLSSYIV